MILLILSKHSFPLYSLSINLTDGILPSSADRLIILKTLSSIIRALISLWMRRSDFSREISTFFPQFIVEQESETLLSVEIGVN